MISRESNAIRLKKELPALAFEIPTIMDYIELVAFLKVGGSNHFHCRHGHVSLCSVFIVFFVFVFFFRGRFNANTHKLSYEQKTLQS